MISVLEEPVVRERVWPISVATYHSMIAHGLEGQPVELIRGVIVKKMPKSPLHAILVSRLFALLKDALPAFWVRHEAPLSLADSEPEPALSVVNGRDQDYLKSHPQTARLVIEVAISSIEIDRLKGLLYAEAGVEEYWIVLAEQKAIEVYRDPRKGEWTHTERVGSGRTFRSKPLPSLQIAVDTLFPV